MLGKLFKYEIKATARLFLPIYLVLLAYSLIHKLISLITPNRFEIFEIISMVVYIMILACISVVTVVVMIQRFYKNLLSDEGYLMFTLPTKPWKHIVSKLSVSMLWTAASTIVAIMSIFILLYNKSTIVDLQRDIGGAITDFFEYFQGAAILVIIEFLVCIIIGLASNILIIYASIAVGHLFNRHRILASLGAYMAISTATQMIGALITVIGSYIAVPGIEKGFLSSDPLFHLIMCFIIIISALLSAVYFIITNTILSRHLNLD